MRATLGTGPSLGTERTEIADPRAARKAEEETISGDWTITGDWTFTGNVTFPVRPTDIADLELWFKSDAGLNTTVDGANISEWRDQSGNGRHATQATEANQPTYEANAWQGHGAVRSDGNSGLLTATGLGPFQDFTLLAVVAPGSLSVGKADYGGGFFFDAQTLGERQAIYPVSGTWAGSAGTPLTISENPGNSPAILSFVGNGAASYGAADGLPSATGDAGDNDITAFTIAGSRDLDSGLPADIFEILYFSRILTDDEIGQLTDYLRGRYFVNPQAPLPDGEAVVIAAGSGVHNGFPGICKAATGDLIVNYRVGVDHLGNDGVLKQKISDDDGATWGSATTVADHASKDSRDSSLTTLADGTLILTYTIVTSPGYDDGIAVCRRSTDDGATWGAETAITDGFTGTGSWSFVTAPVVELLNGDLIVPLYGRDAEGGYYSRLSRSTNQGVTWDDDGVIAPTDSPVVALYHQEPFIVQCADGTLLCFLRTTEYNTELPSAYQPEQIYLTRSTNQGETWSTPEFLFPGAARPAALQTPSGDVVLMCRQWRNEDNQIGWVRRSSDKGQTWSDPRLINPLSGGIFFVYGQFVYLGAEGARREIGAAMSFQSPDATAYFYRFTLP